MVRAVVIGANGFLGSHLVEALVRDGHEVRAFDRFGSSSVPNFEQRGVEVMQGEFLSRADVERAVRDRDAVFHFLSTTTPVTAEADPTLDVRTNVVPTIELLEACVEAGVQHFYYASTGGAIYGVQGKTTYAETDRALPLSPYGIGKLTIEHYLRYFGRLHDMNATILRISNPYGPRQHPQKLQGLIPISLRRIQRGEPVVVFGDGEMVRDYLYVEDAISMVLDIVRGEPQYDAYNLGSGVGATVSDVIAIIEDVLGMSVTIEHRPTPATFVDRVVLDTTRFRTEFGYPALTDLREGVRRTAVAMGVIDG